MPDEQGDDLVVVIYVGVAEAKSPPRLVPAHERRVVTVELRQQGAQLVGGWGRFEVAHYIGIYSGTLDHI